MSRLEEIKKNKQDYQSEIGIDVLEDISWLIQQAERVGVLEKREEVRKVGAEANSKYYQKIEQENQRYKQALITIATGDNHVADFEDIARQALKGDSS